MFSGAAAHRDQMMWHGGPDHQFYNNLTDPVDDAFLYMSARLKNCRGFLLTLLDCFGYGGRGGGPERFRENRIWHHVPADMWLDTCSSRDKQVKLRERRRTRRQGLSV